MGSSFGPKCNGSCVRTHLFWVCAGLKADGSINMAGPKRGGYRCRAQVSLVLRQDPIHLGLRQDPLAWTMRLCSTDPRTCGLQPRMSRTLLTCQTQQHFKRVWVWLPCQTTDLGFGWVIEPNIIVNIKNTIICIRNIVILIIINCYLSVVSEIGFLKGSVRSIESMVVKNVFWLVKLSNFTS